MNKLSDKELQERANEVFKSHKDEVVVFVTTTGQCFVEKNEQFAKEYVSSNESVELVKFKRPTNAPKKEKKSSKNDKK